MVTKIAWRSEQKVNLVRYLAFIQIIFIYDVYGIFIERVKKEILLSTGFIYALWRHAIERPSLPGGVYKRC